MGDDFEKLNIVLAARDREFARAMDRNTRRIERFARQSNKNLSRTSSQFAVLSKVAARLLPALGAAAVVAQVRRVVASLDDIGKTADKIGLTTDALQELRTVAESAGVAQSALDTSLERFSKRLGEATFGTGAAARVLKEMGLNAEELSNMGVDKALSRVADEISRLPTPTERAARAAALFGREGVTMVNLMRVGADGMAEMRENARSLGVVIDESLIRGAEEAQDKLDLMGRVISSQVSSALVELAPILVVATTAAANFIREIAGGVRALQEWLEPTSGLEIATDNLVAAMGDEIRQSQLLQGALGNGATMSLAMAEQKLEEARARYANVAAIIEERRALALDSVEWSNLSDQIQTAVTARMGMGEKTISNAEQIENVEQGLTEMLERRQRLIDVDAEMAAQLTRTAENIATLEAGVANHAAGVVTIGGVPVEPIDPSTRRPGGAGGGVAADLAAEIPGLEEYAGVLDLVREKFGGLIGTGDQAREVLAFINALFESGEISAGEYKSALEHVADELKNVARTAETMERATEDMFVAIVTGSKSGRDALADLLSTFAQMAAQAAFSGMFGGAFDGVASIFSGPSFAGGGYTGNGPRSGGLDGQGGRLAMIHPQETIIDHASGQTVSGGGGVSLVYAPVIDARGADAATVSRIEAAQRAEAETFETRVFTAVRRGQARRMI